MATNFPTSLDNLSNPAGSDPVNNPSHAVQHANVNDAIEALEGKVGTNNSAVTTSLDYRVRQLELNPVTSSANKIEQIVVNNTGSTLLEGQAVYASGSVGSSGKLRVSLSSNAAESTSSKTFGILAEDIINGGEGLVVTEGIVEGINTVGANDGDPVWLGVNGNKIFGLVNKPYAPAHLVFLGIVVRGGQANTGSIFVKIQNGFELEELHSVQITSPVTGEVLVYDATTSLWKNSNTIASKTYVDTAVAALGNTSATLYVPVSEVGQADGIATLDANSRIPLSQLGNLVDGAPTALDTLNELAAAINDDASYAATITTALGNKLDSNYVTIGNTLLDGISGQTYGLIGTSAYLDVKNTNGYNKEIELDITAVETKLVTDGFAKLASPALTGTPTAPTAAVGTDSTQVATTAFVIDQIDASTQPGALYQTTAPTSPEIGQIWIDSDENVTTFDSNIIRRKSFTATAGQTVFVTDIPFINGFEQVFMNGLLLVKTTDYAVSGGNTVTLTSGAAVSDVIEIVSVTGANSVNTYTQAEVDALLAANTSVAPLSISANTTLVAKKRYFVTSASALTLTLPASPALNDEIQIVDASGNASTYNITVARNANKINGGLNNLIIDTNGGWYTLLYTGTTYGWKVG